MGRPRSAKGRAGETHRRLADEYPDAECELDHDGPFQLLAATILSAQCTDKRVNMVTPALFAAYPRPENLAGAVPHELEELVRSPGFYVNQARSLLGMAQRLVRELVARLQTSCGAWPWTYRGCPWTPTSGGCHGAWG